MGKHILTALMGSALVVTVLAGSASAATFNYTGILQVGNNNGGAPGPSQVQGGIVTGTFDQGDSPAQNTSEVNFLLGLLTQVFGTSLTTADLGSLSGSGQLTSSGGGTTNAQFSNTGFGLDNQGQPWFDKCAAGTATSCQFSNINLSLNRKSGGSLQAQIQNGALTIGGTGGGGGGTKVPEPGVVLGLLLGTGGLLGQRRKQQA
jgi:hypothetical protein